MERWRLAIGHRRLRVLTFPHYNPRWADRHEYYHRDPLLAHVDADAVHVIPVLITCFNEDRDALHQSLTDLYTQQQELQRLHRSTGLWLLHVVVILDGWYKSSPSMRDYLFDLLSASVPALTNTVEWRSLWNTLTEWADDTDSNTKVETMIIQVVDAAPGPANSKKRAPPRSPSQGQAALVEEDIASISFDGLEDKVARDSPKKPGLKISFLIKRDNRRKHNSHEWCLLAFAPIYAGTYLRRDKAGPALTVESVRNGTLGRSTMRKRSASLAKFHKMAGRTGLLGPMSRFKLTFLTDCGTRFHPACLGALVDQMLVDDTCVACSGRQRVMSSTMQETAVPSSAPLCATFTAYDVSRIFISLRETMYRAAQCFDYEASISAFNGAFSMVGMVPVIPGPCGLFRLDYIVRSDRDVGTLRVLDERFNLWLNMLNDMEEPLDSARQQFIQQLDGLRTMLQQSGSALAKLDEPGVFEWEINEQRNALESVLKHGQAAFHLAIFAVSDLRAAVVRCAQAISGGALIHITEMMEEALWVAENTLARSHGSVVFRVVLDEDEEEQAEESASTKLRIIDEHEVIIPVRNAHPHGQSEEQQQHSHKTPGAASGAPAAQQQPEHQFVSSQAAGKSADTDHDEDETDANNIVWLLKGLERAISILKMRTSSVIAASELSKVSASVQQSKRGSLFHLHEDDDNKSQLRGSVTLNLNAALVNALPESGVCNARSAVSGVSDLIGAEDEKNSMVQHHDSSGASSISGTPATSTPDTLKTRFARRIDSPTLTAGSATPTQNLHTVSTHSADKLQLEQSAQLNLQWHGPTASGTAISPAVANEDGKVSSMLNLWAMESRKCLQVLERVTVLADSCASQLSGLRLVLHELLEAWKAESKAAGGENIQRRSIGVSESKDSADKLQPVDMARDACDLYFKCVNKKPEESGLLLGCLLLAEDRVLSYAAVMKPPPEHVSVHTSFVPNALFYFEAETEALKLFNQRRRWINGTIAGYIWLLQFARGLYGPTTCSRRGILALLQVTMILVQVIMYFCVALAPSMWMLGLKYSSDTLPDVLSNAFNPALPYLPWAYLGMYVLFVIRHTESRRKVDCWDALFIHTFTLFNMLIVFFIFACLVSGWENRFNDVTSVYPLFTAWSSSDLVVWGGIRVVVGSMILPLVLAIMYDIYWALPNSPEKNFAAEGQSFCVPVRTPSCLLMLVCAPLFYFFLPTMIGTLGAFSLSRTWDLTWGNRPSVALHSLSATLTPEEQARKKRELFAHARVVSYTVLLANLIVALIAVEANVPSAVVELVTIFVLLWAAMQAVISLCFIVFLIGARLTCMECLWRLICARQATRMGGPVKGLAQLRVDSFDEDGAAVRQRIIQNAAFGGGYGNGMANQQIQRIKLIEAPIPSKQQPPAYDGGLSSASGAAGAEQVTAALSNGGPGTSLLRRMSVEADSCGEQQLQPSHKVSKLQPTSEPAHSATPIHPLTVVQPQVHFRLDEHGASANPPSYEPESLQPSQLVSEDRQQQHNSETVTDPAPAAARAITIPEEDAKGFRDDDEAFVVKNSESPVLVHVSLPINSPDPATLS